MNVADLSTSAIDLFSYYTNIPVEEHSNDPLTNPECDRDPLRKTKDIFVAIT